MKRKSLIIVAVVLLLIAGGAFANRGKIREAYGRWQRGPIPEEMTRAEMQAALEAAAEADTETQPFTNTNAPATNVNASANVNAAVSAPAVNANKPATNVNTAPAPKPKPTPASAPKPEKSQLNLSVLFIPQAPHKIWDELHEDTCEEVSMMMLEAYQNDVHTMSLDEMERRMVELVDYEKEVYGGDVWKSMNASVALEVMHKKIGLTTAKLLPVTSINDVKAQLAKGRPVLLFAAGKLLKNPNFKNGGPLYHALVAKGYTETTIITNDPGTRLGENYAYDNDVLFEAIHDWNDGDVYNGAKLMIVVE